MSTRGLRLRRPCPGTTSPRVLRALAAAAAAAVAETKMAGRIAAFLRNVWAKEPVLVASLTIGGLAIILPALSPYVKYSIMINEATPYNYPADRPTLLCGPPAICSSQWPTLLSHSAPPRRWEHA
ncbi:NADH dehydrogenase [ubiquinone] 1 alpha subcomplex subunit 3 isoform X1 [Lagenorhynchus albirostris]|uniref:NADH dehydrogenase [ubiquinone] 1 alpha subcomplex subunit 3 isoform X1 n=1 Tax=Lagenorhynchus albirostris TaxID=27610 RepID=UPI0028E70BF9|nr:NADH dehydrogenase [ubiquinone] 1 alpha subcomplex subunit 3 isoform X1 [Lagenorhynchus albirostris]XP_059987331.1 NADH dehydrogenase [ubiquinone] 1 alpha subcomplex subunit 3 isoform X1 [Lagenorhynchus albirostris]